MTQEDVRRLLDELGGEASIKEISSRAEEKFPQRSLHTYVGELLHRLEKKELVTEAETDRWKLTNKGKETSLGGVELSEVNTEVDQSSLEDHGLEVVNLVGTIQVGREFDLTTLVDALPDAEYHPESSPFLVYRPEGSATLLVPTNGLVSVVGAKTVEQTERAVNSFFDILNELGIQVEVPADQVQIQNIVVKGDFGVELDLDILSIGIGLERCEYEPEQFPGIVFRSENDATVLIFRTGKYLIMGEKSYANALQTASDVTDELRSLGINIPS